MKKVGEKSVRVGRLVVQYVLQRRRENEMSNDAWTARTQSQTLANAINWGEGWTMSDLEFVTAFATLPDAEVALALGRTLFSVQSVKHAIRAGRVTPAEARARRARVVNADAYRGWVEGDGDE